MSAERKAAPTAARESTSLDARWGQRPGLMPALEAARRKLGGRSVTPSARAPGALVETTLQDGMLHLGVLLWASAGSCDVWFDDALARRARSEAVVCSAGPTPESLVRIEAEIRMFAALGGGRPGALGAHRRRHRGADRREVPLRRDRRHARCPRGRRGFSQAVARGRPRRRMKRRRAASVCTMSVWRSCSPFRRPRRPSARASSPSWLRASRRARGAAEISSSCTSATRTSPPRAARFARVEEGPYDAPLYRYGAVAGLAALKARSPSGSRPADRGPRPSMPAERTCSSAAARRTPCSARRARSSTRATRCSSRRRTGRSSVGVVRAAGGVPVEVPLTTGSRPTRRSTRRAAPRGGAHAATRAHLLHHAEQPRRLRAVSSAQLAGIARLARRARPLGARRRGVRGLRLRGVHASIARLDGMAERTLSAYSLSKSHALAGARVGFLVGARAGRRGRAAGRDAHGLQRARRGAARRARGAAGAGGVDRRARGASISSARDTTRRGLEGSGVASHLAGRGKLRVHRLRAGAPGPAAPRSCSSGHRSRRAARAGRRVRRRVRLLGAPLLHGRCRARGSSQASSGCGPRSTTSPASAPPPPGRPREKEESRQDAKTPEEGIDRENPSLGVLASWRLSLSRARSVVAAPGTTTLATGVPRDRARSTGGRVSRRRRPGRARSSSGRRRRGAPRGRAPGRRRRPGPRRGRGRGGGRPRLAGRVASS